MKTYRAILLLGCVLLALAPPFAFSQESGSFSEADSDQIQSRGLSIGGCEIKYKGGLPDFNALKNCVNGKIDKINTDAKKATDAAKAQAQGLRVRTQQSEEQPFSGETRG